MTKKEILKHLRSSPKVYEGVMPQSTFANTLGKIERNTCKQSTIDGFFEKFGFVKVKDYDAKYEKL